MIKTESLVKLFRTDEIETLALNQISLRTNPADFIAIMGPSGCGKSTLLNILGLLDTPTQGAYFFNGKDVSGLNEKQRTLLRRGNIGFVFQSYNLIDELTVYENVMMPLVYLNMKSAERKTKVTEVLDRLKISHRVNHFSNQLSGGQQRRVAIARAVVTNPGLILADEPTGNLDSQNGMEVMNLLSELNQGGTMVIMVTHSQRDAAYAKRILNMFDGSLIMENLIR